MYASTVVTITQIFKKQVGSVLLICSWRFHLGCQLLSPFQTKCVRVVTPIWSILLFSWNLMIMKFQITALKKLLNIWWRRLPPIFLWVFCSSSCSISNSLSLSRTRSFVSTIGSSRSISSCSRPLARTPWPRWTSRRPTRSTVLRRASRRLRRTS